MIGRAWPSVLPVYAILLGLGCSSTLEFTTPIPDDGTFPRALVEGAEFERYSRAAAWSETRAGLALVVIEGGAIVFEQYAADYDPSTPVHLFSGTKSFSCPAVLALEDAGVLSLDERVVDTLPDLRAGSEVRVRHLLDFSSGIADAFLRLGLDGFREEQRVHDKVALAVSQPRRHAPGERFVYGGAHQWVLSGLLHEKLGRSALETFEEVLLGPIGLRTAGWYHDPAGHTALPYGAWTTATEWAKFGVLMRDDGVWGEDRVLPEGTSQRCFAPSEATEAYGMTFWRNGPLGPLADANAVRAIERDGPILGEAPADTVGAAGHQDQRLYIIQSLDLVVVRLGRGDARFKDAEFLAHLLDES